MKIRPAILLLAACAASSACLVFAQAQNQAGAPAAPAGRGGGGGGGFGNGGPEGDPTPGFGRPMIDLYEAGVAGSRARGSTTLFDDLETTMMTRFEEKMEQEITAVRRARVELIAATFTGQVDSANLQAKAKALADAELALAIKRANEFPALRAALGLSDPERMANFAPQMNR